MLFHSFLFSCITVTLILAGCSGDPGERNADLLLSRPVFDSAEAVSAYIDSINALRHYKDEWMSGDLDSPLDPVKREIFEGLKYFPVDLQYVFRTEITLFENPDPVIIQTTTGDEREAVRYGYFDFSIEGQEARLYGYKFNTHRGTDLERFIFVPFKDKTSGIETYAGGRYLDLEEELPGIVLVDFNDAYNPYCVYNERYSCPLPPDENHLEIRIEAGEKALPLSVTLTPLR